MTTFKASQEAAWRRYLREAVKASGLTKSERDVTLALLNLWLHHRNGPKKCIHPGRSVLAKKAGVSEKTVSRTLAALRDGNVLRVVSRLRGEGQKPTEYRLSTKWLLVFCGADLPEWMDADLVPSAPQVVGHLAHHLGPECPTTGGTKCPTDKDTVWAIPSQWLGTEVSDA